MNENIATLLSAALDQRARHAALIEPGGHAITFAELDLRARMIADRFQRDGIAVGDVILFFTPPSAALYASLIACWRVGAVAAFVEPSAGQGVLDRACEMCTPAALIASPKAHLLRLRSAGLRRIPRKYTTGGWVPGARRLTTRRETSADAPVDVPGHAAALLTFTSGSTGQPKGAVRSHAVLRAQLRALTAALPAPDLHAPDLVALPIVVLLNLAHGVTTILPDTDLRRPAAIDPEPVLRQIATHGAGRITASPAFLERLATASSASHTLSRVRHVVTGGGPVFPDLISTLAHVAPNTEVIAVYGSTEAEPIAHHARGEVTSTDLDAMRHGAGLLAGTIDRMAHVRLLTWPLTSAVTSLTDLDRATVPQGEAGEIVVSGDHVVPGYLHGIGDAETKLRVDGVVWHRTGDLGRLDGEGRLWLLGRAGASLHDARGAFHPLAVECAVRVLFPLLRCAALGVDDQRVLVLQGATEEQLARARHELAWARLDRIERTDAIPLDRRHNAKVDYPELARRLRRSG